MITTSPSPAHTAGPWFLDGIADNAFEVGPQPGDFGSFRLLARVFGANPTEAFANASLVAAAPDLLAAANTAADILASIVSDNRSDHGEEAALNGLATAIAKAEGRA